MSDSPPSDSAGSRNASGVPEQVLARIEAQLRQREIDRDDLAERSRRLRRLAQGTMGRIHSGAEGTSGSLVEIERAMREFTERLRSEGRNDEGLARDALQESVEAALLGRIVAGRALPGPDDLGVDPEPYLLGLGDVVGEVRRLALRALTEGKVDEAERALGLMDNLYQSLMRFDTPRAIVALKPKQDTARALVERTRGEVTLARLLARAQLPPSPLENEGR
jgi:translin